MKRVITVYKVVIAFFEILQKSSCTPCRSVGGRPIGQEIMQNLQGQYETEPIKMQRLMGGQRMKYVGRKCILLAEKHYAWAKKTLRRTFVSFGKTVFSPFGRKKQPFFLRKQKFASEFFCPWHNVSSQKEHILSHKQVFKIQLLKLLSRFAFTLMTNY